MTISQLITDEVEQFFAPVSTDAINALISKYQRDRVQLESVSNIVLDGLSSVFHYFTSGNLKGERYISVAPSTLFNPVGAVASLNSAYWSQALALTDVLDFMPQKRREEWNTQIHEMTTPDFVEDTVRATLMDLILMRSQFFSERVDGVFRALSKSHVTNTPEGFNKRMIIENVISSYGTVEYNKAGYIHDLRCIVAKFMGLEDPSGHITGRLIDRIKNTPGEWVELDGGALRIKVFKKGTAHLEVHPDMAWRLNAVLASLYPAAIPSKFRTKPESRPKEYRLIQQPISTDVREMLYEGTYFDESNYQRVGSDHQKYLKRIHSFCFKYTSKEHPTTLSAAKAALEAIGGVVQSNGEIWFDYNARDIIQEIIIRGCLPDDKSHQFYPTPKWLAERLVDMAELEPDMKCLEPEAGLGAIADVIAERIPNDKVDCVEISELRCEVLKAKGYMTLCKDFLTMKYDHRLFKPWPRIIMNPPFSEGRALAHVKHASTWLTEDGILVAIMPASYIGKDILPGFHITWSERIDNAFDGAGVSVALMKAVKK
ncbi:DUF4942 domain-containing protein [Methylovulum miyakonense]|uniref:DUF4942 domain-containing protein n=1 Tax=Methylovulum miyakonense TaxID=645578 RepID=UPI00039B9B40|nr:DUF4942 domain-containing protein [Methylovulum miyakonense]